MELFNTWLYLLVIFGYCRLIQVNSGSYRLIQITTYYYRLIQVNTGYYILLHFAKCYYIFTKCYFCKLFLNHLPGVLLRSWVSFELWPKLWLNHELNFALRPRFKPLRPDTVLHTPILPWSHCWVQHSWLQSEAEQGYVSPGPGHQLTSPLCLGALESKHCTALQFASMHCIALYRIAVH